MRGKTLHVEYYILDRRVIYIDRECKALDCVGKVAKLRNCAVLSLFLIREISNKTNNFGLTKIFNI